jgi:hypothetical protein
MGALADVGAWSTMLMALIVLVPLVICVMAVALACDRREAARQPA